MRQLTIIALLLLTGCSRGLILCPDAEGYSCIKNYCIQGQAIVEGNGPAVGADLMGQIWSHGFVMKGEVPEAVQIKALEEGCTGDPPALPWPGQ